MTMNLGTQDKKKVIMAASFGIVAVGCLIYMLSSVFGGSSAPPPAPAKPAATATVAPAPRAEAASAPSGAATATYTPVSAAAAGSQTQDPELRLDLMRLTETTEYSGTGRNVFSAAPPPVIAAPIASIRPQTPIITAPPGPPPPPPIDLQFYGYATSSGRNKRIFLKHGDDIFIASEGDIVNKRYRIKSIAPTSVQIEDILNNDTQSISLSNPQG